jgi:putative SOS response-associated peptidase YedK
VFALDETWPLAFFAGIWTRWVSVRKVKEGETTNDIRLPEMEPNAIVAPIHPKAMLVILTRPEEASTAEALKLQRPLHDDAADRSVRITAGWVASASQRGKLTLGDRPGSTHCRHSQSPALKLHFLWSYCLG